MVISRRIRIWLFYIMTLFFWFANYTFVPYLSAYAAGLTQSTAMVGMMLGSYGWAQLTLRIPIGILSDRYNNRRIFIRLGCLSAIIAAAGLYWSPNILWLMVFRTMSGVSVSVWVVMSVLFNANFERGEAVKAMTRLNTFNLLGQMFASIIAMPVTAAYGVRSSFLLAAAAGIIPMGISLTLKDKPVDRKPLAFSILIAVGRTPWVMAVSLMAIISQTMSFATTSGFTPQIALRLGAQPSILAYIQLVATLGGAIFSMLSSRLFVNRFGARNSLVVLLMIQAITCALQPIAPSLPVLLLIVFFNGLARGTSLSMMLGLVVLPFPYEKQAAAMGFYQALYSLGITLGPTIAGAVMQASGLDAGFYVISLIGLLAPIIGITMLTDERKKLPSIM